MTPVRWLLIRAEREVGACFAETKADAEAVLKPGPASWVVSAASFAVGLPKAVRAALAVPERICERCERKPRAAGGRYCLGCKATLAKEAWHAARKDPRARQALAVARSKQRREARVARRNGPIRAGIARRRLARTNEK